MSKGKNGKGKGGKGSGSCDPIKMMLIQYILKNM